MKIEYTQLAKMLGVDNLLTPEMVKIAVHSGFARLGVVPEIFNCDDLCIRVGYSAVFHGGQASYDSHTKTVHLGVYRAFNAHVAERIDEKEKAEKYFDLIVQAAHVELQEYFDQAVDTHTVARVQDDVQYVFGDLSLADFDLRALERYLAHELGHAVQSVHKNVREPYRKALQETASAVIGTLVEKGTTKSDETIQAAARYGYSTARETRKRKVRHLKKYCNSVARHMYDILVFGDEETKLIGLRAASLSELKRLTQRLHRLYGFK